MVLDDTLQQTTINVQNPPSVHSVLEQTMFLCFFHMSIFLYSRIIHGIPFPSLIFFYHATWVVYFRPDPKQKLSQHEDIQDMQPADPARSWRNGTPARALPTNNDDFVLGSLRSMVFNQA